MGSILETLTSITRPFSIDSVSILWVPYCQFGKVKISIGDAPVDEVNFGVIIWIEIILSRDV